MSISPPRSGYTLPVFACASAIASLQHLHGENELNSVTFNLLEPPEAVTIAIEQVTRLNPDAALAITRSEPGDNLDLTRNTPIKKEKKGIKRTFPGIVFGLYWRTWGR